jgi:predicted phage terminase large subunit-like protein
MRKAPQLAPTTEEVLPALLRQHFSIFLMYVFRELAGNREFKPNWHLEAMEHRLNQLRDGDINQLIVAIPPRHLKSITISVAWVAWMIGNAPHTKFSCASYSSDLAEKHARDCLKVMESSWYRKSFPNVRLTKRATMDIETSAGGGRLATSVGGSFTGRGGDWVIIDDPMKGDDALSEAMRETVKEWFQNTARHRADDDKTRYIILMQRLHEDDLAGHLLRQGDWTELKLQAIATCDELVPLTRGRWHHRRAGCVLSPSRHSLAYLLKRQTDQPYVFEAQYQQNPIGRIGAFVMPEWFLTYDIEPQVGTVVMSVDTAVKTTVRNDWSVAIVARFYRGQFYVLDVWRDRVTFTALKAKVRELASRYGVDHLLIEDASSGQSLIQQLRDEPVPGVPFPIAITPIGDKIVRFEAQASRIQAGQVVLPRTAPWHAEFVAEVTRFPGGQHDDQADALAQMLANPPVFHSLPNVGGELLCGPDGRSPDPTPHFPIDPDDPWGA